MSAMSIPHGAVVHFDVVTHNPLTGQVQDADSAPAWKVWGQVGDMPCRLGSMTKRTDLTGHYKASFGLYTVDGFDPGEFFQLVVEATVGGVTAKKVVMTFRVLAAETATGSPMPSE